MSKSNVNACIIVDSSSGIRTGEIPHVYMTPLHIIKNENGVETQYKDLVEITTEEVIKVQQSKKASFKSSQSSLGEMIEMLEDLTKKYQTIYVWPISKGLSSSYNTWNMAKEEFKNSNIIVIDSGHINISIKNHVQQMSKMILENRSEQEILDYIKNNENNWAGVLIVNDLTELKNGGRISSFKAFFAKTLKLNILISYDGELDFLDKEKDFDKTIDKVLQYIDIKTDFKKFGIKNSYIYSTYIDEEKNKKLMEIMSKKINFQIKEWYYFPAVIALHTGGGTFALFIESNKK